MIEEAGLSPKPWLVFWVRLMRNKLHEKTALKLKL
jgi:hypothetical protein